jgi:chromosome segregation protein
MHLKRLEIHGFKSFADSIKLDFEPGITAVVGPNGCGKSNIIDAIRWCLGEMSAKSLRSTAMLDVVFNGSGARPPQNLAEVTLTFDNADKRLPIDYSDVSITRRLFRSGESEYYINKTQCRLRDIKELFLDTGMGEDGYSSLEQGKVEWILQAKPEERRELFEEAAGVSKYRARREEAMRKLERVDIDLSRLADIVAVTSDQIRKLENSVNKAKTYQRIREELKNLEVADWLYQLDGATTEMTGIRERLESAQRDAEERNTETHTLDAELSEHRTALTRLEEELLAANQALNAIDADIKIGEERIANAKRREVELEQQDFSARENIQREEGRILELQRQKVEQQTALEALRAQGGGVETDFVQSEAAFKAALENLENKKVAVKEARDLILDRAQERARTQQQISNLTSDAARLENQVQNLEKERQRSQATLDEAQKAQLAAESQANDLRGQAAASARNVDSLTHRIQETTAQREGLRARLLASAEEIARLKGRISSIRDQQAEDPYMAGAQAVISERLPGIQGPLGRLIQCADADRDLVAATIGEHLGDLVADSADDAERAVTFLRDRGKGRARIWILERLPQASRADFIAQVSTGIPLISRLRCEEKFEPVLRAICDAMVIQGSNVYANAVVNGGMDPAKWQSHQLHRLPELEAALEQRETEKGEQERSLIDVEAALASSSIDREAALKEMNEVRVRLELAEEEAVRGAKRCQIIREEQQVVDQDLALAKAGKVKAQVAYEEAVSRFNTLQDREKEDHDQLDLLQQELTELQHLHAKSSADLSAQQERHRAFQEKVNWQASVQQHTERELASVQASIARQSESISRLTQQIEAARAAQAEAAGLVKSSLSRRTEAAGACGKIQTTRAGLSEKIQAASERLSAVRSALSSAQEAVQTELLKEANLKSRVELLTSRLQEQYEMTVETARDWFKPAQADPEALDKLKKRVANIGPINLAAPQEYDELVEKNTFLLNQQADLLKAKEDLKQVIQKINATTREHFKVTFDQVRENFRSLYARLFQGGEADLHFTDETDILNTGIDIFCQPPGKKLLHISLLSGGEKALTAIALLFAFFMVRPSPIALLDEVDAPLDEANVLRYADMLKTFSENSQFVLISHNKRTMEIANTLYGVTMEELGVSKVLSARLARKQAAALTAEPAEAAVPTAPQA